MIKLELEPKEFEILMLALFHHEMELERIIVAVDKNLNDYPESVRDVFKAKRVETNQRLEFLRAIIKKIIQNGKK